LEIMESASGQRDPLPPIKPSSESPAKENEKKSEQPRTNNISVRTGYSTNQLAFLENHVMKQMMQHRHSWPFREPVDAVKLEVPYYYDVIKEPMDFGTIERKLKSDMYSCSKECLDDFSRVFSNCYAFNKTDSELISTAKDLEEFLHEKLSAMPELEFEIEVGAKYNIEGQQRREAAELQDYLSSYFSTKEKGRKRNSVDRLVVGGERKRKSLAVEHMSKEAKSRSNYSQIEAQKISEGVHADNIKAAELGFSSVDIHEHERNINDNLEKKIVKVSRNKTQKKFGQQGRSKAISNKKKEVQEREGGVKKSRNAGRKTGAERNSGTFEVWDFYIIHCTYCARA